MTTQEQTDSEATKVDDDLKEDTPNPSSESTEGKSPEDDGDSAEVAKWKKLSRKAEEEKNAALAELDRYRKAEEKALDDQIAALGERTRDRVAFAVSEGLTKASALKLFSEPDPVAEKTTEKKSIRPGGFDKKPTNERGLSSAEEKRQAWLNEQRRALGRPIK